MIKLELFVLFIGAVILGRNHWDNPLGWIFLAILLLIYYKINEYQEQKK